MSGQSYQKNVQKLCTLLIHDSQSSKEDVIFNHERFPELGLQPGSLAKIVALREGTAVRDFEKDPSAALKSQIKTAQPIRGGDSTTTTFDESGNKLPVSKEGDNSRSYVFLVKESSPDQKQKQHGTQISISSAVANVFGFRNRMQVLVAPADEETHSASHVEITFRDEYLSRADMWRLAISELSQRTVYKDQKLLFLDTIKATVKNVYIRGQRKKSAYFAANTRPIFRSESARFILFIQMSREMWEFDAEGGGEIMFNKVINGFLPELFKNWMAIHARHLVSIILFTRLDYDEDSDQQVFVDSSGEKLHGGKPGPKDFYRVVVSDVISNDWVKILYQLKMEFRTFLRDVSIQRVNANAKSQQLSSTQDSRDSTEFRIVGKPTIASKGNILEVINLASSQFSRDYIDRDLVRTGISVVVVTAGTGVYEVDYNMLKLTTDTLIGSGIGIDLVCLSPMPLHSVPLFKYRNPRIISSESSTAIPSFSSRDNTPRQHDILFPKGNQAGRKYENLSSEQTPGDWSYAMPHWIDISFWNGTADEQAMLLRSRGSREPGIRSGRSRDRDFSLRCVLYELEMMGFMENEMTNICLPLLHDNPLHPWNDLRFRITGRALADKDRTRISELDREWMDEHDENIFRPLYRREAVEDAARKDIVTRELEAHKVPHDAHALPSETYSDQLRSPITSSFRSGAGYLDWRMKERQPPRTPVVGRKSSVMSLASTDSSVSRVSKFSRHISFSSSGFAAPKAVTGTDMSLIFGDVSPATFISDASEGSPSKQLTGSIYLQQIKAALTRSATPKEASQRPPSPDLENSDRPSKPINIGASRNVPKHSRSSSTEDPIGSVETVKGNHGFPNKSSLPKQSRVEDSGAILYAAANSRRTGPKPDLSSSGDVPPAPETLSPVSALAPWLVLVNPSNPRKNNFNVSSQFRRWQHVFPKRLRTASMKWKSLSSPASVPLTNEFFPTPEQLANEYQESPYKIVQNVDDELHETPRSREALIRELIAFRLVHGFQLIVGSAVAEFLGSRDADIVDIFDKDYMAKDGATVFMSVGSTIHQLLCLTGGEVEVRRFRRKPTAAVEGLESSATLSYRPYIRTLLDSDYVPREITLKPPPIDFNWNFVDTFIAGYHDQFSDTLRFWRARFVFIPVDIPTKSRRPLPLLTEDSEEEIRIEGIRKLTQIWLRHRVLPPEERVFQSVQRRTVPNPLMIEYQTRDPSVIIAARLDGSLLTEGDALAAPTTLFSDIDTYSTKNVDLQKVAHELQGERGIKMLDRRWHWKLYHDCFLGSDFTSWLMARFRDILSREDAVSFGNELMEMGLFQHVQGKHQFRDGNFFYHISSEYRASRPDSRTWLFGARREKGSVPSTPMTEQSKISYPIDHSRSRPATSSSSEISDEKATASVDDARRKVTLSNVMRYNVDTRKQSYRQEIINLHFDRLHNPDNCYHIRIDWMNVTAKFIEDAIVHWAMSARKYGLKLVEVPIAEASKIMDVHPFRSPYIVKLAVPAPQEAPLQFFDSTSFGAQAQTDKFAAHKAILKRLNFVLDVESASSFPPDVDVIYSWGSNEYRYTQYIHRSGTTLAQIMENGNFLLLANRLYNDRSITARESTMFDRVDGFHDRRTANSARHVVSPTLSPTVRPVPELHAGYLKGKTITAEEVKEEVEAFCQNANALKAFYEELMKPRSTPSLNAGSAATITPDSAVPSLQLPPNISSMQDPSSSPALMSGQEAV